MLKIQELRWSNLFSYGTNNSISLDSPLIQLVGKNGSGKSSIALILEEVLYNKNSKGIKKADILNRFCKDNKYNIELDFQVDDDSYSIKTSRSTLQTVKLFKNGIDISSHTATNTYKQIEDIIKIDHKTFCQIVYQSNAYSLDFLTSTDSARKKFLIDLFSLNVYTEKAEKFKNIYKTIQANFDKLEFEYKTLNQFEKKILSEDLEKVEIPDEPEQPEELRRELAALENEITNLTKFNSKIKANNTYKTIVNSLDLSPVEKPTIVEEELTSKRALLQKEIKDLTSNITSYSSLKPVCSYCGQKLDNTLKLQLLEQYRNKLPEVQEQVKQLDAELAKFKQLNTDYNRYLSNVLEYEKLHILIDSTLPEVETDKRDLENKKTILSNTLNIELKRIDTIVKARRDGLAKNAKIDLFLEQLETVRTELGPKKQAMDNTAKVLNNLSILLKAFSNNGLVAYKLEGLVKNLETRVNDYLQELSDGRFNISFELSSSDKLNVTIIDNGIPVDINCLSNGEKARVNVATVLAIRSVLNKLSSNKINLLFLDETVENLDVDGKEKLIEVLLKEPDSNTILVSHGFTHPLLEKLHIIKTKNISRITNG